MLVKSLVRKIFGSRNERVINRIQKTVSQINALESQYIQLSDEQLKARPSS